MFSPDNVKFGGIEKNFLTSPMSSPPCYVPSASPAASVTSSCPYSPAPRIPDGRFSSTDSTNANSICSSNSTLNLKEGLNELAALQKSIVDFVDLDVLEKEMQNAIRNQCSADHFVSVCACVGRGECVFQVLRSLGQPHS